jgi:hypothetical protein
VVTAERVDGYTDGHRRYGAEVRSGSTSRPRYVLQVGQTRCERVGEPHVGQTLTRGASIACCARRLSRRALLVFRFGTAIGGCVL